MNILHEIPEVQKKPIAIAIATDDIQALFACGTSPHMFNQLILAKLKDAGAPVEGMMDLKLAHGRVFKLKDDPLKPQEAFEYLWLPEEYVYQIAQGAQA